MIKQVKTYRLEPVPFRNSDLFGASGKFRPTETATRGEIAYVIHMFIHGDRGEISESKNTVSRSETIRAADVIVRRMLRFMPQSCVTDAFFQ